MENVERTRTVAFPGSRVAGKKGNPAFTELPRTTTTYEAGLGFITLIKQHILYLLFASTAPFAESRYGPKQHEKQGGSFGVELGLDKPGDLSLNSVIFNAVTSPQACPPGQSCVILAEVGGGG